MKANGIFITGTDTEIGKDKLERINPICLLIRESDNIVISPAYA